MTTGLDKCATWRSFQDDAAQGLVRTSRKICGRSWESRWQRVDTDVMAD
jgi:hypothetical protein